MSFDPAVTIDTLKRRAEWAESELRRIEHERVEKMEHDRIAIYEANERSRAAEREAAQVAESDSIRRASWLRYWTSPAQIGRLAEAQFSPTFIANNTPNDLSQWPPDDNIENHRDELTISGHATDVASDVPSPLVLKARAMGLPI
jgi:hypothetical protein